MPISSSPTRIPRKSVVASLLAIALVTGGVPLVAQSAQAAPAGGIVTGHVVVPAGDDPTDADIRVVAPDSLDTVESASPDSNGDFTVSDIASGTYKIEVTFSSFGNAVDTNVPTPQWYTGAGLATAAGAASLVTIASGQTVSLQVSLNRYATLSGHVAVPSGDDPTDAVISVVAADTLDSVRSTSADHNGDFLVDSLVPGAYKISVTYSYFGSNADSAVPTPQWYLAGAPGNLGLNAGGSTVFTTELNQSTAVSFTLITAIQLKTAPKIKGTTKVGHKLKVSKGRWSPAPATYKYTWLRNGKAIKGATKSTYKLASRDKGKRITVRVTVTKPGHVAAKKSVVAAKKVRAKK